LLGGSLVLADRLRVAGIGGIPLPDRAVLMTGRPECCLRGEREVIHSACIAARRCLRPAIG